MEEHNQVSPRDRSINLCINEQDDITRRMEEINMRDENEGDIMLGIKRKFPGISTNCTNIGKVAKKHE